MAYADAGVHAVSCFFLPCLAQRDFQFLLEHLFRKGEATLCLTSCQAQLLPLPRHARTVGQFSAVFSRGFSLRSVIYIRVYFDFFF